MNGGDLSWDFIFDAVTQEGKEEDAEEEEAKKSGRDIFREPGPRFRGASEETLTREWTGTVMVLLRGLRAERLS